MPFISEIRPRIETASEIHAHIYLITIRGANTVLIVERELTLIDTGFRGSSSQIVDFIHQLGRSPQEVTLIILTHNHIDHVGGLIELKQRTGARVAIHRADIGERENLPSARATDIDIRLEGGEVLKPLGGLEVVHTPGHTPGSVSLFSAEYRLLFVGDALRKRRESLHLPYRTASFDLARAVDSVRRIACLDCETVCFGHGLPLSDGLQPKIHDLARRF